MCRCCGKPLSVFEKALDNSPIHTLCVYKHWAKHDRGINASRCREFGRKAGKVA